MRVCLISVPYDLGRYDVGQGSGPRALLSSGLDRVLSEAGHQVNNRTLVLDDAEELTDTQTTFRLNGLLSQSVAEARGDSSLPIVLAANCITSVGTLSGLGSSETRVVWLDAHADFNTPDTTVSGYLDGMGLAIACGRCWRRLASIDPRFVAIEEENVTLVGTRDVDPEESTALAASRVRILRPDEQRANNHRFPAAWGPLTGDLYVHLDADVLDTSVGRANTLSSSGGLTEEEVVRILSWCISSCDLAALAVSAYNPRCDETGAVREALKRIITAVVDAAARDR